VVESEEEAVVSLSRNQRWAGPGEPTCVVCGRYGAYIVDETDMDVCSLQCKGLHLDQLKEEADRLTGTEKEHDRGCNEEGSLEEDGEVKKKKTKVDDVGIESITSSSQIESLHDKLQLEVNGLDVPKPITRWDQLSLNAQLSSNLSSRGYELLTPVQMQVVPAVLYRRDLLVSSATGSGKSIQ
jgi:ATP-dependent RNA helicase DDX59